MRKNEASYEKRTAEIKTHFKMERRKALLIWLVFEIIALPAAYFITKAAFDGRFLQWFLVAIFFIVLFPTTLMSSKLKALSRTEREQIRLLETDF